MEKFLLPEEDLEYLKANFPDYKCEMENSKKGIIIPNYPLPKGYSPVKSNLMLMIPDNYPTAKIDMFYFLPNIARQDGAEISALNDENHFNQKWQRWSRHYDWRPGIDNIATHISYIHNQLKSEVSTE